MNLKIKKKLINTSKKSNYLTYFMLKESRVEIFLKAVLEDNRRLLPQDFIRKADGDTGRKLDLRVTSGRQIDFDNSVIIVADLELLVREQVVDLLLFVVLANDAPDGQVINVHLVRVLMLDRVHEQVEFVLGELAFAEVVARRVAAEVDLQTAVLELHAEQIFAERLVIVAD